MALKLARWVSACVSAEMGVLGMGGFGYRCASCGPQDAIARTVDCGSRGFGDRRVYLSFVREWRADRYRYVILVTTYAGE